MPDEMWFMQDWEMQPCIKEGKLSRKSLRVLQCLSRDMRYLFNEVYFYYDRGPQTEDRNTKYNYVKEVLEVKYEGLAENIREMIYEQFKKVY